MAVITISRQVGSSGSEIAKKLKEDLGLNYLDKEVLEKELVRHYGLSEKKVACYDEKKPSFWDFSSDKDLYLHSMKTAMYNFAKKGNSILIGRGGQVLFRDIPGTLNIRVFAPLSLRIERIMKRNNCNAVMAERIIRQSDRDREGFYSYFFNTDWNDQEMYDLIINTQTLTVDTAVDLIKSAVKDTKIMEVDVDAEKKLSDICLSQEVIASILYIEKIPVRYLEATATNGVINLKGAVGGKDYIQQSEDAARKIPGVKNVTNEIIFFLPSHT